jgi:hypothetical protein
MKKLVSGSFAIYLNQSCKYQALLKVEYTETSVWTFTSEMHCIELHGLDRDDGKFLKWTQKSEEAILKWNKKENSSLFCWKKVEQAG